MARPITVTPKLDPKATARFMDQLLEGSNKTEVINLKNAVNSVRGKRNASSKSDKKQHNN